MHSINTMDGLRLRDGFFAEHRMDPHGGRMRRCETRFSQLLPHLSQQRIMRGQTQISLLHLIGMPFSTSGAHSDHGFLLRQSPRSHSHFGTHLISGIDEDIGLRGKQMWCILGRDEFIDGADHAFGMDQGNALLHGQHFGLTQSRGERMQLPIDVGFGHLIEIEQADATHAAAGQGFCGPGTDAADANDRDVRGAQESMIIAPGQGFDALGTAAPPPDNVTERLVDAET